MKIALYALVFSLANSTDGMRSSASAADKQSKDHIVEITKFTFSPSKLQVSEGDSITWINRDIVPHTATAENGEWDSGTLMQDESRTLVVTAAMQPKYFCQFHINMKASIVTDGTNSESNAISLSKSSLIRSTRGN